MQGLGLRVLEGLGSRVVFLLEKRFPSLANFTLPFLPSKVVCSSLRLLRFAAVNKRAIASTITTIIHHYQCWHSFSC